MQAILSNFALILFVLTIITGIIWCLDVFHYAKQRRAHADEMLAEYDARVLYEESGEPSVDDKERKKLEKQLLKQPLWIEYTGSFFPVIAAVFFLRSFCFEPFQIPSSSMLPTLQTGDMILVSKYSYGIRLPVIDKKIMSTGDPERGDVVVFRYPKDTSLDYIKRVVGVGGDKVVYRNKRLTVNGVPAVYRPLADYLDQRRLVYSKHYEENAGQTHGILNNARAPNYVPNPDAFPQHELCTYNIEGFACTVPQGHYFVMGDNRDNSLDSRYWGFVPDSHLVGKAFFIWFNMSNLKRIGRFQ